MDIYAGVVGRRDFPNQRIFHLSSAPGDRPLIYVTWILRQGDRVVLVDTGFSERVAAEHGIEQRTDTARVLAQLGLTLGDVSDVVVSHFHYDHFADPESFPKATFHVQLQEIEYWLGRGANHPVSVLADKPSLRSLERMIGQGRVNAIDGGVADIDGIRLMHVGGHTPGSQITTFEHHGKPVVLACDASHTFDNLRTRTPAGSIHNYDECQRGFQTVETLATGGTWFPGHDDDIVAAMQQIGDDLYQFESGTRS